MANLLAGETSPYLLQHAQQPVHWRPWGPQALEEARQRDVPILLSVGYSACHWCHVMAHESFDDAQTAAQMNARFVCIKVDREERPDIDQLYQQAHRLLTRQRGGWPLTAFLSPHGVPFHSGTYYPAEARDGRPAFRDLLDSVAQAWAGQREAIAKQDGAVLGALQAQQPTPPAGTPSALLGALAGPVQQAAARWLLDQADGEHGGFGTAPKFPHAADLAWLMERATAEGDEAAGEHVRRTLVRMAEGGLFDQLAGGFFRYSVDERWEIPHFEKMLADNGPLLALYAEAAGWTGSPLFGRTVEGCADWLMQEMALAPAGFAASLDADAEGGEGGGEGAHYLWTPEQVRAALTPLEWDVASAHWNLMDAANFEGRLWHLRVVRSTVQLAATFNQPQAALDAVIDGAATKLLALRRQRPRPARDDKRLVGWNALAATGLVRAALVAGRADWLAAARATLDFIGQHLWQPQPGGGHRLRASAHPGHAPRDAFLDDHAFLLEALLALLQADFRAADLQWAQALADALLADFEDAEAGGFFFTRHDHEALIQRFKPGADQALPSGNAVAAGALLRLGHLVGDARYLRAAERTLLLFATDAARQPGGWSTLLRAAAEHQHAPTVIVLRGAEAALWRSSLLASSLPHTLVLALPGEVSGLPAALDKPLPPPGTTQAWVCSGSACESPVDTLQALRRGLGLEAAGTA